MGAAARFGQSHPFLGWERGDLLTQADLKCPSRIQCCAVLRNGSACSLAFYGKECLCNTLNTSNHGSQHRPCYSLTVEHFTPPPHSMS